MCVNCVYVHSEPGREETSDNQIPLSCSTTSSSANKLHPKNDKNVLICSICSRKYNHVQSLKRHIKMDHQINMDNSSEKVKCLEDSCCFSCRYISQLRNHLQISHHFQFELWSQEFDTYEGMQFAITQIMESLFNCLIN